MCICPPLPLGVFRPSPPPVRVPSGRDPSGRDPSGWDPSGRDPSGWDPSGRDPSGRGQSGRDPSGRDPSGWDPSGRDPSGRNPSRRDPSGRYPSGRDPSGRDPSGRDSSGRTLREPCLRTLHQFGLRRRMTQALKKCLKFILSLISGLLINIQHLANKQKAPWRDQHAMFLLNKPPSYQYMSQPPFKGTVA
jgi:hypothetical protein